MLSRRRDTAVVESTACSPVVMLQLALSLYSMPLKI